VPRDLNKIQLIGRVGGDPDMRFTASGMAFVRFRLAVNRVLVGAAAANAAANAGPTDRPPEETEWFTVVAWNKLAETCNQYVTKGQRIYVEGRLSTRSWEGQRDGQRMFEVQVTANDVIFLERRTSAYGDDAAAAHEGDDMEPEDLPF